MTPPDPPLDAPLDPSALAFRPLAVGDLPRLHAWFQAPHARQWFGSYTLPFVMEEFTTYIEGTAPVRAFLVLLGERPVGMVAWSRFADFPDLMQSYEETDPEAVNCDVILGEPDVIRRGLGAPLVLRFLRELVFCDPRVTSCLIDPHLENTAAIRAYAKAGFRHVRDVKDDEDGRVLHLMQLRRSELLP